jgi:hypothetical protein
MRRVTVAWEDGECGRNRLASNVPYRGNFEGAVSFRISPSPKPLVTHDVLK